MPSSDNETPVRYILGGGFPFTHKRFPEDKMVPNFHDLVASMRVGTASDGIYDDLTKEYSERDEYANAADAKIGELSAGLAANTEVLSAKDAEISRLKSQLYDTLANAGGNDGDNSGDGDGDGDLSGDDADGVDGMFEDNE